MNCPFSKFKNVLGEAGKGVHSFKILDTAMVDYFLTIMLAFVFSYLTGFPLVLMTILLFIVGIICHMLFGINTTTLKYLKINCN